MSGSEYGAAVLVGKDRGIEGPDFSCRGDNLLLVEAYAGSEHRYGGDGVGDRQRLHRLRGDLTHRFSGDQRSAVCFRRQLRGDPHHVSAQEDGEILLGAVAGDLLLDLGERYDMQPYAAGPERDLSREGDNLFSRLQRGELGAVNLIDFSTGIKMRRKENADSAITAANTAATVFFILFLLIVLPENI